MPYQKQVELSKSFLYIIKHKSRSDTIVANVLYSLYALISLMKTKMLGFQWIKDHYKSDLDFSSTIKKCEWGASDGSLNNDGYSFRYGRLCFPHRMLRGIIVKEAHGGGLHATLGKLKPMRPLRNIFVSFTVDKNEKPT